MSNTNNIAIQNDLSTQQLTEAEILLISGGTATADQVVKCMDPKSSDAQIYACLSAIK